MVFFGAVREMNYGRMNQITGTTKCIPQGFGQRSFPYSPDRVMRLPHGGILPRHSGSSPTVRHRVASMRVIATIMGDSIGWQMKYPNSKIPMAMMNLFFIMKLQLADQAIEVTLQSQKVVTLAKSPRSYEYFTKLLIGALESKRPRHPVGLAISEENEILAVERADNDFVVRIMPENEEIFNVWLRGHDGIFKLDRNHPGFDRIYTTLDTSRTDSQRIWFIADRELKISDVLLAEA
jgi:hypothetical protein